MKRLDKSWVNQSISCGTLRPEDLIPAFLGVLEDFAPQRAKKIGDDFGITKFDEEFDATYGNRRGEFWNLFVKHAEQDTEFLVNEVLFGALDEIAPKGTSFGAHPGDGTDFGFWTYEEETEC